MSITKTQVRSSIAKGSNVNDGNNERSTLDSPVANMARNKPNTKTQTVALDGIILQTENLPKKLHKQKSKIVSTAVGNVSEKQTQKRTNSTMATIAAIASVPILAGHVPTTVISNISNNKNVLPQNTATITTTTNLLKIEPFVPSLNTTRPSYNNNNTNKIIRRSYSTLSTTALKKRLNTNLAINLGVAANHNGTNVGGAVKSTPASNSPLPKMLKTKAAQHLPQNVRRRPPVRGNINRQRSKSTSSSNSASNRPNTSLAMVTATTPSMGTPTCATPNSAIVIPQPNGICRIQRNPKDQEKLPDRINYDKRGLTAIPIFENEPNLRLLSLQHNLINTFHIPKEEVKLFTEAKENQQQQQQLNTHFPISHNKFSFPPNSPNHEQQANASHSRPYAPPSSPLTVSNLSNAHGGGTAISYTPLPRNALLQRSINLNQLHLQQPASNQQLSCDTAMRFSMRKSKSFVNNFQLQYQLNKRGLKPQRSNLLKRLENSGNLMSIDSTSSAISTMTVTTTATTDSSYPTNSDGITHDAGERSVEITGTELEIKNKQLLISYGNIFKNLVFLDLYDNQIERISNLDGLGSLSVLLLGKNRISDISGLSSLKSTLRVLDLHGNKICSIANKINCLKELKSLNLAGNQIRQINHNDFLGLANLKELNLKRNKLKRVNGFQHLCSLERLWLCHNDLHKVDDMASIAQAFNIIEITIENNPVSLAGDCVSFLVSHLPKLQSLSQMPITEQVRQAAMTWRSNKELSQQSNQQGNKEAFNLIRREEIISNARTNWELLRSQQFLQTSHVTANNVTPAGNKLKGPKRNNMELEKINETNEQSYEEFLKLPPIEAAVTSEDKQQTREEHNSSTASSLGPNVNSSSSCYTSADEQDAEEDLRDKTSTQNSPMTTVSSTNAPEDQLKTDQTASSCTPTLTIEFPLDSSNDSRMSQHQSPNSNQTSLINANLSASSSNTSTALMTTTPPLPKTTTSTTGAITAGASKRYVPSSLMRSQTIVGTGGFNGGYAIKANVNTNSNNNHSNSKISVNTTTTVTANNINILRYHSAKLNPASSAAQQQAAAATTATTTCAPQHYATPPHHIIPSTSVHDDSPASCNNSTATTTTVNANKLSTMSIGNTSVPATISSACTNPNATGPAATSSKLTAIEREREQGGDYLIEICGRYLNIYGQGALRFIDKQWNPTKANDVHTLNFSYINFNNITAILSRIKIRFPHAEHFVFRETNIHCLGQLNALAELQGLTSLYIDPEGNPLTNKEFWRQYAIYRLSHWGLKTLNGLEVTAEDVDQANSIYVGLSDLILWSMPDAMLHPLLARLRLDESCSASKMLPKQWLLKPDNRSLRLVVGKEALQWKKSHHSKSTTSLSGSLSSPANSGPSLSSASHLAALTQRERGKIHFTIIMENTCHAVEKLHRLEQLWPMILLNIVRNTLLDYAQLDVYIRDLMTEIMK
uniref:Dynein axonemal assembly factor 1 homolog n=1 Tax=Musca domestica TaxID=7370 RepID=A0A1I8MMN0_MUSDO